MTLEYHPAVQSDFNEAVAYYAAEGGTHLADRFEADFRICIAAIQTGPGRFARYQGSTVFRRVRLDHFPYVIVYREIPNGARVTLLKHERRHPLYGARRQ